MIFSLFSLNCSMLFSATLINFRSFLSPRYLHFFSFLNNFMLSFSSENSTLFSSVFSFSKMFLVSCNILFLISILAFYHKNVSTWLMFNIYISSLSAGNDSMVLSNIFSSSVRKVPNIKTLFNIFSSVFFWWVIFNCFYVVIHISSFTR